MHYHYKRNLLKSLSNPQDPWHATTSQNAVSTISLMQLDEFSDIKWENLLRFIVGAKLIHYNKINLIEESLKTGTESDKIERQTYHQQIAKFSEASIRSFLKAASLITEDASNTNQFPNYTITAGGYEYMLKDKFQQVRFI
jgi:hypothetical protein